MFLDCKEIQPVHSEGDQPWDFFGRNDAKAKTPVLWPPHGKSWLTGKDSDAGRDWGQEEKGTTEDEMAGWHHWLDGHESEWTPGVVDGQGGLACCDSWGRKESDTTERLNWTELNGPFVRPLSICPSFIYIPVQEVFAGSCECVCVCVDVAQLCPTLCDPMDSTVHGILQARVLEWVAVPFSRVSSHPRDWTQISRIAGRFFTSWATGNPNHVPDTVLSPEIKQTSVFMGTLCFL